MLITTVLTFFVLRYGWRYPGVVRGVHGCFFVIDLAFFSSNLLKLFQGGWFPLLIGGAVFTLMMTWKQGPSLNDKLRADAIDLRSFGCGVRQPPTRVEGTAVFLQCRTWGTVPNALLHNLKHNKVLHAQNLFVTVRNHEEPWIGLDRTPADRGLGARLLAGHHPLRVQERPRRAARPALLRGHGCDSSP